MVIKKIAKKEINLRYKKPWISLFMFCIPTILMWIVMSLYNLADKLLALAFSVETESNRSFLVKLYNSMIHSASPVDTIPVDVMKQYINVATQYASQSYSLMAAFAIALAMGVAMIFSINYGKRDFRKAREVVGNGFSTTILTSILIMIVIFAITFPDWNAIFIRSQMGNQWNPITEWLSWEYSFPMLVSMPLFFITIFWSRILSSEGRINFVVSINIIGILISCIISVLLMIYTGAGLYGPMIGTAISWLLQSFISMVIVFTSKESCANFNWTDFIFIKFHNVVDFAKSGLPNFIINISFMISSFIATTLVVNIPNQVPTPAENNNISILQQVLSAYLPWTNIILSVGIGVTQGTRTIIAYNYGAKKYNRIIQVLKRASIIIIFWFTIVFLFASYFSSFMLLTFYFPEKYVAQYHWYLFFALMSLPLVSVTYIALAIFQGINWTFISSLTTSFRSLTINIPLMLIGYWISLETGKPYIFFIFLGLVDVVSSIIIIPIFIYYWKKYKNKLIDHSDNLSTKLSYLYTLNSSLSTLSETNLKEFKLLLKNNNNNK